LTLRQVRPKFRPARSDSERSAEFLKKGWDSVRASLSRLVSVGERLSGKSVFESKNYRESQLSRLLNLFTHIELERFRGMRILEVGAGIGHLGDVFAELGFDVTSTDGRSEHVEAMRARGRDAFVLDLDSATAKDFADYDIVLSFGVLYHLARPEEFLISCAEPTRALFLETAVCDSTKPVINWVSESRGWRGVDQALEGRACRPSPAWVEEKCREGGYTTVRDISSPIGNWAIGKLDWDLRDTGEWRRDGINLRKMWVCEKSAG
jgi:SAM-dependent methyltransferase